MPKNGCFKHFFIGENNGEKNKKAPREALVCLLTGGEGGIRTHGSVATTPDFESGTFDHSATSPAFVSKPVSIAGSHTARMRRPCKHERSTSGTVTLQSARYESPRRTRRTMGRLTGGGTAVRWSGGASEPARTLPTAKIGRSVPTQKGWGWKPMYRRWCRRSRSPAH